MEIIYTSRFEKDIQSIDSNVLKKELLLIIEEIKKAENLSELH